MICAIGCFRALVEGADGMLTRKLQKGTHHAMQSKKLPKDDQKLLFAK